MRSSHLKSLKKESKIVLIATIATWLGTIMSEFGLKTSGNVISSLSLLVGGIFAIIGGIKFVKILLTKREFGDAANNNDQSDRD